MSISTIQYAEKKKEFIQELLKKGVRPDNYELTCILSDFFSNKIQGMPYYSPAKQNEYEASDREAYNHNFKTLEQDLKIMYKADAEANNRSVAIQQYYDTEKIKTVNSILKLAMRIKNIKETMDSSFAGQQYSEVFDDLYDIDYSGSPERNIPATTSFVDLLHKKVYTDKSVSNVRKLNISESKIQMDSDKRAETKGNLSDILTDTIDSFYVVNMYKSTDAEHELNITVKFPVLMDINAVSVSFTTVSETVCTLYISENDKDYIPAYDISALNAAEWHFPGRSVSSIRICFKKNSADGITTLSEDKRYMYSYIIKNISASYSEYDSKSVLVTKPIEFSNLINSIRLDASDRVFNDTRIDYFIGLDNGKSKVGWDVLKNHENHDLNAFEKKYKICNYSLKTTDEFGEQDQGTSSLYRIFKTGPLINMNSVKVIPGYGTWSVIKYVKKAGQEYDESFKFSSFDFTEYTDQCTAQQFFMDAENYTSFRIDPNTLHVFTQYIRCDSEKDLYNRHIRVMDTAGANVIQGVEQKVFLNGSEICADGNKDENLYSFPLRKGMNKVQIAIYAPAKDAASGSRWLYHNVNFKEVTNDVSAFLPMKQTNWNALDSYMIENYEYYTVKDGYVCVKCNPQDLIRSDMEDMGYLVSYHSLVKEMRNYFGNNKIRFRIMAVFNSKSKETSPELTDFRLTGR